MIKSVLFITILFRFFCICNEQTTWLWCKVFQLIPCGAVDILRQSVPPWPNQGACWPGCGEPRGSGHNSHLYCQAQLLSTWSGSRTDTQWNAACVTRQPCECMEWKNVAAQRITGHRSSNLKLRWSMLTWARMTLEPFWTALLPVLGTAGGRHYVMPCNSGSGRGNPMNCKLLQD